MNFALTNKHQGGFYIMRPRYLFFVISIGAFSSISAFAGIKITSATYGRNCGVNVGNVTYPVAQACNGQQSCQYYIDHRSIGDPAVGCAKNFIATYHCGDFVNRTVSAPEEASGRSVVFSCSSQGIQVGEASYGVNCGVPRGNVTQNVRSSCDNRSYCNFTVNHHIIGDPAVGCAKDFSVNYRCGSSGAWKRAYLLPEASGHSLQLDCSFGAMESDDTGIEAQ
jgi:hypothetical protein